jgi:PAS domain S-box-containing protein
MTRARAVLNALTGVGPAGAFVIALGVIVLIGWATGIRELTTFLPSQPAAKANSALLLVLAGVALLLWHAERLSRRTIARGLALAIVALTGMTLLEYVTGVNLGVDALIPTLDVASPGAPYPGRIALHAAIGLLAAGLGIGLLGRAWRGRRPAQLLGLACALIGAFDLLAYLYSAPSVATIGLETQVSLPVAVGELVLGVGVVVASPDHGLVRLLRDRGMAGRAARRILPAVLVVAPLAGWMEVGLERAGLADDPVAPLGWVAGVAGVIFGVAWWALVPGRAAETALRESEERFRGFFEKTPDYAYLVSAERRLLEVNPAALEILGYASDELVGRPLETIYAPECLDRMAELFEQWRGTGHLTNEEMTIFTRSGERRTVLLSAAMVRDAAGRPLHSLSVQRDVTELRKAEEDLELQVRIRTVLAESLHRIPVEATLEEAAQVICDELVTLPFIDMAAVDAFVGPSDVQVIGYSAPIGHPVAAGDYLPPSRAALVRERAAAGPWAQYIAADPADGEWLARSAAAGLKAVAYGPIVHGDHVGGTVVVGTYDEGFARTLVEHPSAFLFFSTTSSALLAERLHEMRRVVDLRRALASLLAARAFRPVFQPIVDLESGQVVGYEALTRFDSGRRPDLCFADAWSVGLGPDLEIAALDAAISVARRLPTGPWLNLNVSPRLFADPERLRAVFGSADRPLVLEVTEHEVIENYEAVRDAIRALDLDIRLAVDDAGAGVANFGHIVDLRPDFVKLDIGLVRSVNADLGRQALVVGMVHFSRHAGCRLVGEGIETEEELRTLAGLGVQFGQGYLFGRPEPIEAWIGGGVAGREAPESISPTASDSPDNPLI